MEEEKQPFKNHLPGCHCVLCNSYRRVFHLNSLTDFLDFERINLANIKRSYEKSANTDKIKWTYNKKFEEFVKGNR